MRLTALVFAIVMGASSVAFADPVNGHDVPFSMDDAKLARDLCGENPAERYDTEIDYCARLPEMTDAEVLERIEAFRTNCLEWIDIKPRIMRLIEAHDPFLFGVDPIQIDALCSVPQPLRPNAYARVPSDPGFFAATLSRLKERAGNAEKAEALAEELLADLQAAYTSLRLQTADGQLKPATMEDLRTRLDACSESVQTGPERMLEGATYDPWETGVNRCVESSTQAVFEYARDGEPRDLDWMWWTVVLALIVSLVLLVLWNRRHSRELGHVAINEWQTRISSARQAVEESAREADEHELAEHNLMLARLAALEDWAEAFGDDATVPDVKRSAEIAHIHKRGYRWSGFDNSVPEATLSGNAEEFMARVQRFIRTGDDSGNDSND